MKKFLNILSILTTAVIVFVIGISAGDLVDTIIDVSEPFELYILHLLLILIFFYASVFLHLIFHEGGHLVFGLASGYRFVSFRVLNQAWLKQNGKIVRKKYTVAGTAGQCLMAPPKDKTALIPFVVYNMGGVMMNLLISALSWVLYTLFTVKMIKAFFLMMCGAGIILALTNGIPLSTSTVNNDGWNMVSGCLSANARRAFADVLEISARQSDNVRLRDIDPALFWLPEESDRKNTLAATMAIMCENRLMDEHRFDEAETLIRQILSGAYNVVPLYYDLLKADLIYIDVWNQKNSDEQKAIMASKKTRKVLQSMGSTPAVLRTRYAYEKYTLHSDVSHIEAACEKARRVYPYQGEFETEDELIALLDQNMNAEAD